MSLDNSKYKIFKIIHNNKPLTIFKFEPDYKGFSFLLKIFDLPINILTLLIFILKYKSIGLALNIFNGNLDGFAVEKNMVDHELEVLKNSSNSLNAKQCSGKITFFNAECCLNNCAFSFATPCSDPKPSR